MTRRTRDPLARAMADEMYARSRIVSRLTWNLGFAALFYGCHRRLLTAAPSGPAGPLLVVHLFLVIGTMWCVSTAAGEVVKLYYICFPGPIEAFCLQTGDHSGTGEEEEGSGGEDEGDEGYHNDPVEAD